ncbi:MULTISPECIES: hypothetical protein [Bradyrhizobium]|jgi:hypothetical protein|uniref:hypothetical protein n=1 Tax=Bradyrhizobium TaxID=374 RepID=UPI002714BE40|nr:hypothetical protein [Bradyrhizobium elkanii]WLA48149.1 hypothetical protein QIH80_42355 [Bradyrhizobium elkanii]WLB81650.1 hypothetical protein QIH83_03090 [Bradyrhizobium elkanii]
MKSIFRIALALAIFAGSTATYAQTSTTQKAATGQKGAAKNAKRTSMHDGCHSRAAQMSGKPCH